MAIKAVVTRGFGNGTFAGTIALVALRGYSSYAGLPAVDGPYCIAASQAYVPGAVAMQAYVPGAVEMQAYVPGAVAGGSC